MLTCEMGAILVLYNTESLNDEYSFENYNFSSGIPFYRMYKNNMVGQQHFSLTFGLVVIIQELLEQGKQNLVWIQNIHIPKLLKYYTKMHIKATNSWDIKPGSLLLGRWRQYDPMKCS